MKKKKKTFNKAQINNINCFSHNNLYHQGKNKNMDKIDKKIGNCNLHVMPSLISDNDISALFNGLLNVVKKKFELDNQSQFIHVNYTIEKLKTELKNKINECNRLKNEIIFLKSKISQKEL